jgi:hypothetical protein
VWYSSNVTSCVLRTSLYSSNSSNQVRRRRYVVVLGKGTIIRTRTTAMNMKFSTILFGTCIASKFFLVHANTLRSELSISVQNSNAFNDDPSWYTSPREIKNLIKKLKSSISKILATSWACYFRRWHCPICVQFRPNGCLRWTAGAAQLIDWLLQTMEDKG